MESIKQASEITSLDTKTNSSSEILKMLSPNIGYSKEGYTGTLTLDTAGIVTAASGYGYRNVPVTKTREYPGLIYADPSYIPGSITENGVTLSLSGIEWVVTGTGLAGDTLVPTEYKAVATYSGSRRETYVTGYTTTAKYTGTVTKKTVESVTYTITYIGTLIRAAGNIPVPTTTAPTTEIPQETETLTTEPDETDIQETTEPDANDKEKTNAFNWLFPVVIAAIIIASLAAVVLLFLFHPKLKALLKNLLLKRSKIKASVYNLVNGVSQPTADPNAGFALPNVPGGGTTTVTFSAVVKNVPPANPTLNTAKITFDYTIVEGGISSPHEMESNEVPLYIAKPIPTPKRPYKCYAKDTKCRKTITGHKIWEDNDNKGDTRPPTVEILLLRDGEVYRSIIIDSADNDAFVFYCVPIGKRPGHCYDYRIDEANVPYGYTKTIEGYNVINTRNP